MASVRVETHPEGLRDLLIKNPAIVAILKDEGEAVRRYAEATAQAAQGGPQPEIVGYAEAGFTVEWQVRSKRPQVVVKSNDTSGMQWRAHFSTIKRFGVAHMRAALYSITGRGA